MKLTDYEITQLIFNIDDKISHLGDIANSNSSIHTGKSQFTIHTDSVLDTAVEGFFKACARLEIMWKVRMNIIQLQREGTLNIAALKDQIQYLLGYRTVLDESYQVGTRPEGEELKRVLMKESTIGVFTSINLSSLASEISKVEADIRSTVQRLAELEHSIMIEIPNDILSILQTEQLF